MSIDKDFDSIKDIEKEWCSLLNKSNNKMVFQTSLWNYEVGRSFSREKELFLVSFRKGNELIGIFPLRYTKRRLYIFSYKVITFLTHSRADCQDVIGETDINECVGIFAKYLKENNSIWDILYFKNIPEYSGYLKALQNVFNKYGLMSKLTNGVHCPTIDTSGKYDDYVKTLKKKMLGDIRRREKRLKETGEVVIQRFSGETELSYMIEELIKLHRKRWNLTNTPSKFNNEVHVKYYHNLIEALYREDILELYYIKHEEKYIAFFLGSSFNNEMLFHTPCFDPEYIKFSPSKILLLYVVKECFESNINKFNFLAGAEEYKWEWTQTQICSFNYISFKNMIAKLVYEVFYDRDAYKIFQNTKKRI